MPADPLIPRAEGAARLSVKALGSQTGLDRFQTSGSLKVLFPRARRRLDGILINTAGGLTGGDRMSVDGVVGRGASLGLTTQAAERAYRALSGIARVRTHVRVAEEGALYWLPQELILFDGSALDRRLRVDLAGSARLLLVEPLIFGREAMGESVQDLRFRDRIEVTRSGAPLYRDVIRFEGNAGAHLLRRSVAAGARALVSLLYVAPDAEAHLGAVRALLPDTGGASCLARDVLVLRCVARDGFELRRHLLPVLDRLSQNTLPVSWRL